MKFLDIVVIGENESNSDSVCTCTSCMFCDFCAFVTAVASTGKPYHHNKQCDLWYSYTGLPTCDITGDRE